MDTSIIQERLDRIMAAMVAKGLIRPEVDYWLTSGKQDPVFFLTWTKDPGTVRVGEYDRTNKHFYFSDGDVFDQADAWVAAQPNAEERKLSAFQTALGHVIDLGRENSIEVEFLNPLIATAKSLAENVITHQPRGGTF